MTYYSYNGQRYLLQDNLYYKVSEESVIVDKKLSVLPEPITVLPEPEPMIKQKR